MSSSQKTMTHPDGRRELVVTTRVEKFDGSVETTVERKVLNCTTTGGGYLL